MRTETFSELLQRTAEILDSLGDYEAEAEALQAASESFRAMEEQDEIMAKILAADGDEREDIVDLLMSDERTEH